MLQHLVQNLFRIFFVILTDYFLLFDQDIHSLLVLFKFKAVIEIEVFNLNHSLVFKQMDVRHFAYYLVEMLLFIEDFVLLF